MALGLAHGRPPESQGAAWHRRQVYPFLVAAGYIPPRLIPLLGAATLEDLDEEVLSKFLGLDEAPDLDFKKTTYGNSDSDKKELAYDVADRANDVGGLIVIGVEEAAGRATVLTPVTPDPYGEEERLRIQKVVSSRIFPHPEIDVRRVDSITDVSKAFYVISIPPSDWAPHAVSVGDNALRYPRRSGTGRRWLSESEIADAYRNRHRQQDEQVQRVRSIHEEMCAGLDTSADAYLVVSVVPNRPGRMRIARETLEEYRVWVNQRNSDFAAYIRSNTYGQVRADYRSIRFSDAAQLGDPPYSQQGRMYDDGAGSFVTQYEERIRSLRGPEPEKAGRIEIPDEMLLADVVNSLQLLGAHAVQRTLTGGDAVVLAQLVACTAMPAVLTQFRTHFPDVLQGSVRVDGDTPLSRHMVGLEDIATPGPALLRAARPILVDLMSAFGIPAPDQLPEDGSIDLRFFYQGGQEVKKWAERYGVEARPR